VRRGGGPSVRVSKKFVQLACLGTTPVIYKTYAFWHRLAMTSDTRLES
jgi:hypothetical protein